MEARLLPIYLNDHLLGATLGLELARRTLRENEANEWGRFLAELVAEIEDDRRELLELMRRVDVAPSTVKVTAGRLLERAGRLKPNGRLRGYSPLSRLLELEAVAGGIDAKLALWLSLREIAPRLPGLDVAVLDRLAERARAQRERLEPHRLAAAAAALER